MPAARVPPGVERRHGEPPDDPGLQVLPRRGHGERPEVFVTFLNVLADGGAVVPGLAIPVDRDALEGARPSRVQLRAH